MFFVLDEPTLRQTIVQGCFVFSQELFSQLTRLSFFCISYLELQLPSHAREKMKLPIGNYKSCSTVGVIKWWFVDVKMLTTALTALVGSVAEW